MIRTADDVNRMANLLALKIENRRPDIRKHTDYVRGKRGTLKFASDEFKRYMADRFSGFADNWCLPVAQAPVERIHFKGFIPYDDHELDSHVMRVWERNDCDRKLQESALMMTTTGRAFGLVTSMPDGRARISFEHPDSAAVHYDPLTGEVDAGLLVRYDEEHEFGTLLLPDMVFDVVRVRAGGDDERNRLPPGVDGWRFVPDSARANPLGRVPLVEFRNQMLLDDLPISDVEQVESMQDAVNVCWAYTLNALDFASMPARVILGGDSLSEPVFDKATGEQVGERPVNLDKQVMERIMQITGRQRVDRRMDRQQPAGVPADHPKSRRAHRGRDPHSWPLSADERRGAGHRLRGRGSRPRVEDLGAYQLHASAGARIVRDGHDARGRRGIRPDPR